MKYIENNCNFRFGAKKIVINCLREIHLTCIRALKKKVYVRSKIIATHMRAVDSTIGSLEPRDCIAHMPTRIQTDHKL